MDSIATQLTAAAARLTAYPEARVNRAVGIALMTPSATVLGIARWLEPSPTGVGTHLQLGMSECAMLHFTGYPCPMCGMTTTFSLLAHLRPVDGALNQPFGLVLFSCTLLAALVGGYDVLTAKGLWRRALAVVDRHEQAMAGALLIGLAGGWIYKALHMHPELLSHLP